MIIELIIFTQMKNISVTVCLTPKKSISRAHSRTQELKHSITYFFKHKLPKEIHNKTESSSLAFTLFL